MILKLCNNYVRRNRPRFARKEQLWRGLALLARKVRLAPIRLDELQDPLLRSISIGKLEGYTHEELATRLNVSVRTVERKLHLIRRKWSEDS